MIQPSFNVAAECETDASVETNILRRGIFYCILNVVISVIAVSLPATILQLRRVDGFRPIAGLPDS